MHISDISLNASFLLDNYAGLVQFLNTVFISVDPHNDEVYDGQSCSMNDVLTYVWNYSHLLQDKSPVGFGRWCSGKNIDFIHATVKRRKVNEEATISVRLLYVLKEKYIGKALDLFYFHSFIHTTCDSKCCKVYCRTITFIPTDYSVFQK